MNTALAACLLCLVPLAPETSPAPIASSALTELTATARVNRTACGPLSVWFALGRLGHDVDANALIEAAELKGRGTSIRKLLDLLEEHDCPARAIKTHRARLSLLPTPTILLV